jgi:ParB family transcriptional regulator, chromosome partitioning protein
MPDPVQLVPLAAIDDEAVPRDRTGLDPEPLRELRDSILGSGLRMPVELFPLAPPHPAGRFGIISGFRRIAVFRDLDAHGLPGYAEIPAFLRSPADLAATLAAMVEENEIRADLSPWERGRIAWLAVEHHLHPTIDAAVDALYPRAERVKKSRIRSLARLAEVLEGAFTSPEKFSLRQLMRIAAATQNGFLNLIQTTLEVNGGRDHEVQWNALEPILRESEAWSNPRPAADPEPGTSDVARPRRVVRLKHGLVVRREMTRDGYSLHFSGRGAQGGLLDEVLDNIEQLYGPR